MKRLTLCLLFVVGMFTMTFAQTTQKFAVCKVVEKNHKVKVLFGENVNYLGTEYEEDVLYFDKKKLKFGGGQEAVSYLSDSWGWILCGNPTQLKGGAVMWTLKHEVDNKVSNYARNMRTLDGRKRYYAANDDGVYYGYDGSESH